MVILYFVRWFNIILVLRFLFQPGRLCTKLGFFVYYYLPYCYLHQTQENENVRTIKEGKIILKIALRIWSYVLDFLFSNPIVWSYIFRRISFTILPSFRLFLYLDTTENTHYDRGNKLDFSYLKCNNTSLSPPYLKIFCLNILI